MSKYKFTYFLNTACAERRPQTRRDLIEDWIVEEREYPTALEAFEHAYLEILGYAEDDLQDLYEENGIGPNDEVKKLEVLKNEFDCIDPGDGSNILISIKGEGPVDSYDSGFTKESFNDDYMEDDDDYNDDDYLDENKKLNESNDEKIEILQKVRDIVSNIEGFNFISLDTASVLSFNYKNKYIDIKFFVEDITTNLIDCNIHLPNFGLYNELKENPKYNELIENTFKNIMRRIDVCNFDKDLSIDNLEGFINNLKNNLDEYLKIISNKKDLIKFLNLEKDESKKLKEDNQLEIDEQGLPVLEHPYNLRKRNDGRFQITSSHPYDETDYAWAVTRGDNVNGYWLVYDSNPEYSIYMDIDKRPAQNILVDTVEGWDEALQLIKDLDSKKKPNIDRT